MNFFAELKRRNVFRVGITYLIVAWLVMQVADVVINNIGAPGWVFQVILLVLCIGFPLALIFAWAFEMTPDGLKKEKDIDRSQSITPQTGKKLNNTILILMALAIAYLLFDKFSGRVPRPDSSPATELSENVTPAEPAEEPAVQRQSIAVLPFENRSNREEDQFFTDGIHDDLLTTIARIGSMKVISRTSVMEYKNTTKKIPEIAKELGVANILEGGIQRSGEQVRINVQLIDAQTDEHLWAEIFDRELTAKNLFAIQSEISQKIADALETTLSPEETKRINTMPTQNLAAYDAYMRGKQLMATRESSGLEEAAREFRNAVELDPQFALAWVGIADSYLLLTYYGSIDSKEAFAMQQEAVDHAIKIDPGLGEAYVSLAKVYGDLGEHDKMEAAFKKAIELSPNYATAYHFYSGDIGSSSRGQEALELMRKAVELDPRSAIIGINLADLYLTLGLYSRAEQQYKKIIDLNPRFSRGYYGLGDFYGITQGRFDLASQNYHKALLIDPDSVNAVVALARLSLNIGDVEAAERYRNRLSDLNNQDWQLGWLDMGINLARGNTGGIRDAWNWMRTRVPNRPSYSEDAALLHLTLGDPMSTREIYLDANPDWINPEAWAYLVDRNPGTACLVAWTFANTGDEALGSALLDQTLDFIGALPGLIENSYAAESQFCYLMSGDIEKALVQIETQLANNHLFDWQVWDKLPLYDQIRFEPRYQAAMAERDRRIAEQREIIDQANMETGL